MPAFHRSFFIAGAAGRLEAMLWTAPEHKPSNVALVCHPHPLFGGTMHNKVVYRTAKALHDSGLPVLRFNFRGAGLSDGVHDQGRGEQEDVRSALDYLRSEFPDCPVVLAGFSFGCWVGLRVGCNDDRVRQLIGLGLPVNNSDLSYLTACRKSKLFIQGEHDEFGEKSKVESLFAAMPAPKQLVIVESAGHFFTGRLDRLGPAISDFLANSAQD